MADSEELLRRVRERLIVVDMLCECVDSDTTVRTVQGQLEMLCLRTACCKLKDNSKHLEAACGECRSLARVSRIIKGNRAKDAFKRQLSSSKEELSEVEIQN